MLTYKEREGETEWVRERERLPYRGKCKTKEERGGVGGWKNRALLQRQHCLIPLQGFKGALCVCTANRIFNNPWERRHTHTQKTQNITLMRVHRAWHFLSAPLFPPPGSPWHQREQDSLPAGGNERSSWRKEEQGSGEERGGQEEKGRRLMLRLAPWHNSPLAHPTLPLRVDRIGNFSAWLC